jgi:hypothetical protein
MSNPFTGIITQLMKDTHKNMIDALLEDTALTVPCLLYYAGTKWTTCTNCGPNNIGGKSNNVYNGTGPAPFYHGVCPRCNGEYRLKVESTDTLYLCPIWDSKKWILNTPALKTANIEVQTMSKITTYDDLKRATKIQIDSTINPYGTATFIRVGDPEPLGFGASNWIICSWARG